MAHRASASVLIAESRREYLRWDIGGAEGDREIAEDEKQATSSNAHGPQERILRFEKVQLQVPIDAEECVPAEADGASAGKRWAVANQSV